MRPAETVTPPWIDDGTGPTEWTDRTRTDGTDRPENGTKVVIQQRETAKTRARRTACNIVHRLICDAVADDYRDDSVLAAQLLRLANEIRRRAEH